MAGRRNDNSDQGWNDDIEQDELKEIAANSRANHAVMSENWDENWDAADVIEEFDAADMECEEVADSTDKQSVMDKQTEKKLQTLIKEGKVAEFEQALTSVQKDINHYNKNQDPLLHIAIAEKKKEIAKILINSGANIWQYNTEGLQAIHVAAKHGQVDILRILLEKGIDVGNQTRNSEMIALNYAVNHEQAEAVQLLVDRRSDVNHRGAFFYGRNAPLHKAAAYKKPKILEILINAGATVNVTNDEDMTPLHVAASAGQVACVAKLLENHANINMMNYEGQTPLMLACAAGHSLVVKMLCERGCRIDMETNPQDEDCFKKAVDDRRIHVVKILLRYGAKPNKRMQHGSTALHSAVAHCPHMMTGKWINRQPKKLDVNKEIEMLDVLCNAGADVNMTDANYETPMHRCVSIGCAATLDYFLKHRRVEVNLLNAKGHTPLITACLENITPAVLMLIQYCPTLVSHPVNHQTGKSPLLILLRRSNLECLKLLFQAGYKVTAEERNTIFQSRLSNNGQSKIPKKRRQNSIAVENLVNVELENPWTLRRITATCIREALGEHMPNKVPRLPLPESLKMIIMLNRAHAYFG